MRAYHTRGILGSVACAELSLRGSAILPHNNVVNVNAAQRKTGLEKTRFRGKFFFRF